jgi:hypothetical protein
MSLPAAEVEFAGRFHHENPASRHAELHFRFGADSKLLADLPGNGYLAALTDFQIFKYDRPGR